jgi:hypothetical protein
LKATNQWARVALRNNNTKIDLIVVVDNVEADGNVTNEQTRKLIRELLEALVRWMQRLRET